MAVDGDVRGDLRVFVVIAYLSAPSADRAVTAAGDGRRSAAGAGRRQAADSGPGDWLEYSPILTIALLAISLLWFWREFQIKSPLTVVSNLNTYNFFFITLALALHWRPRNFLDAMSKAMPATGGVLIQFPLYGAIAAILTAKNPAGVSVADQIAHVFVTFTTQHTFPHRRRHLFGGAGLLRALGRRQMDSRSALRDAGGQRAESASGLVGADLQRGRSAAQSHQSVLHAAAAERDGLKVRDIVGFTFLQFLLHVPLVLFLLWFFALTLTYMPPVMPG